MGKSIKEIRMELVDAMMEQYVESIGLSREDTYNESKDCWHWRHGSASIEVFVQSVVVGENKTREYLRIFSYICEVPSVSKISRENFLTALLELNDKNLGVKLTLMQNTNKVYATYERDITGMDFDEMATCIADMEWWADKLDDELKSVYN